MTEIDKCDNIYNNIRKQLQFLKLKLQTQHIQSSANIPEKPSTPPPQRIPADKKKQIFQAAKLDTEGIERGQGDRIWLSLEFKEFGILETLDMETERFRVIDILRG